MTDCCRSFTECLQIHTLLFAEKMSVVKWKEVWSSREQDSTEVPDFAFRSFCPIGILLGSAFPKPCFTHPDGCGNLAQRQSFASSIAAQGFENHLSWNRLSQPTQKKFFSPLYSTNGRFLSVVKWKGKALGQNRVLIHLVRWRGFQKLFLRQYQVFEKKCPL